MRAILSLIALMFCAAPVVAADAAELRCGFAVEKITPAHPVPLAGYYSARLSEGVHDDLWAKALVLEDDQTRAALVVCDLITMPRDVVVRARELIAQQTGIPGAHVMISATHTHTGPVLHTGSTRGAIDNPNARVISDYTASLPSLIARAVRQALSNTVPARVHAARQQEHHLSHNRRFHMQDGTVGWNPGKLNPKIVRPVAPIDPDVTLLSFESSAGGSIGGYVNFAMHPDTVGGLMISADYPFTLSRVLSDYKGSNFVTLFANGACGDINHVDVNWRDPQKGHAEAARLGTILGGNALKAFTKLQPTSGNRLRVRSELVQLELAPITTSDIDQASNIVARLSAKPAPKFLDQVFAFKVLDVAARRGRPHEVEVQIVALGDDIAWVSLPGEIFVELGLAIKEKSPFKHTVIAELANGAIGYIPTARAYDEGNYEPISARCAKGSGEKLRDTAVRLLAALQSERP